MKRLIYTLIFTIAFLTSTAVAQDTKIYAGFATLDYELDKGVTVSAQRKLFGYDAVKVEVVGEVATYFYDGERFYTFQAGPQVGVDLFNKRLTPFARVQFGSSKDEDYYEYLHSIGWGVDVNVGSNAFIRGTYDRQSFAGGAVAYRTTIGGGIKF